MRKASTDPTPPNLMGGKKLTGKKGLRFMTEEKAGIWRGIHADKNSLVILGRKGAYGNGDGESDIY